MTDVAFSRIFNMFSDAFYSCGQWFVSILDATHATGVVLGMITLYLVVRYLISPISGSGSDQVTKRRKDSSNE